METALIDVCKADKTAAKLQRSIGNVNIIDTAATAKLRVTFSD